MYIVYSLLLRMIMQFDHFVAVYGLPRGVKHCSRPTQSYAWKL